MCICDYTFIKLEPETKVEPETKMPKTVAVIEKYYDLIKHYKDGNLTIDIDICHEILKGKEIIIELD